MTQRLHDIFGKLYKPPTVGTRQVFALSRTDAERLPQLSSIAVISITAPERPPANLGGFVHVLRLSFADIDFLNPNLSGKAREKFVHAFAAEQARAVRSSSKRCPTKSHRWSSTAKGDTRVHAQLPSHCIDYMVTARSYSTFRTLTLQSFA